MIPGVRRPAMLNAMAIRWSRNVSIWPATGVPGWIRIQSGPVSTSTPSRRRF